MVTLSKLLEKGEYLLRKGMKKNDDSLIEESITYFNKIIKYNSSHYFALESRGLAFNELERYVESYNDFKKNLDNTPHIYSANANISISESFLGMNKSALKHINRAIKIKPNNPKAYQYRGFINSKLGNHMEALDDYFTAKNKGVEGEYINKQIIGVGKTIKENFDKIRNTCSKFNLPFGKENLN